MNNRFVAAGLGLLVITVVLAATYGIPTPLRTGSLNPDAPPGTTGCYTSGTSGELVVDGVAGTAIIETGSGRRSAVTWPLGYTGRWSLWGIAVIDSQGNEVTHTGSVVNMSGGFWTDGSFLACGEVR